MGCRPIAFNTDSGTGVGPGIIRVSLSCMTLGGQSATLENSFSFTYPLSCLRTDLAGLGGCGSQGRSPRLAAGTF